MFSRLTSKLSTRLLLIALMPIAGMIVLASLILSPEMKSYQEFTVVRGLMKIAPAASNLVHEMQKERGMTAGFIGSKGKKFAGELPQQRVETNRRITAYREIAAGVNAAEFDTAIASLLTTIESNLARVEQARTGVDGLSLTVPGAAANYTKVIKNLLDVNELLISHIEDPKLSGELTAFVAFLRGKELAGQERAMGAAGFGAGKFGLKLYNKFTGLIAGQNAYFHTFQGLTTADAKAAYTALLSDPITQNVARMRDVAIASHETGTLNDIDAPVWFDGITRKINLMKGVEDKLRASLISGMDAKLVAVESSLVTLGGTLIASIVLMLGLTIVVLRSITTPLKQIIENMNLLARGEQNLFFFKKPRHDELGEMEEAVKVFQHSAKERKELEKNADFERDMAAQKNREQIMEFVQSFESTVASLMHRVTDAISKVSDTAGSLTDVARQTDGQAQQASDATATTTSNVQTVAAATEELVASISQIKDQMVHSADITQKASSEAESTNERVAELARAASRIGEVVGLIQDIAEQTNLLALNATIEAARAGEMGKGFAVVASEVKTLANQTAKATEEISQQISDIQSSTEEAVSAIQGITNTMEMATNLSHEISGAVDQQSEATSEISSNVQEAATVTSSMNTTMEGLTHAVADTTNAAETVYTLSSELRAASDEMSNEISRFLDNVRNSAA